jgi:hypothetical protein
VVRTAIKSEEGPMGLFSQDPEPDSRLFAKLVNSDRASRKKLVKEQEGILALLRESEQVRGVGVDVAGNAGVSVVTTERVVQVKRGRVINEAGGDRIQATELLVRPNGNYLVAFRGPGLYAPTFFTADEANAFARAVDQYLVATPPGPRDIPELWPDFYLGVLRATGKPESQENFIAIIQRVRANLIDHAAMKFFDQVGDEVARTRFLAEFQGGTGILHVPDRIIDFLWDWDPRSHDPLRRMMKRVHELMTGPDSFLWDCGDEIPPLREER